MDTHTTADTEAGPASALDRLIEQTKTRFWAKLQVGEFGVAPVVDPSGRPHGQYVLIALNGVAVEVLEGYSEPEALALLAELWHSDNQYLLGQDEPDLNRVTEVTDTHTVFFDLIVHIVMVRLTSRAPTGNLPDCPEEDEATRDTTND
jgi:hypothetical protein